MDTIFGLYGLEGIYTEYKEMLPNPQTLAKTMVSFSNTKGGRIILGVQDRTGKIVGLSAKINIEEYVMNIASENCEPIISPIVEFHSHDGKLISIIDVPCGTLRPYHLKNRTIYESSYIRVGSTNRLADKNHIHQLMREAVNKTFDRFLVPNTNMNDLDIGKIAKYQDLKHKRLGTPKEAKTPSFLKKTGIKNDVGGLLLFGKNIRDIPILSRAYIKIGRFKGNEKGAIIDHDILSGTLDEQIESAVQFIRKHMFISGEIIGLKREDRPTYPIAAIREIITNAVIHRDYSRAIGEAIMCCIFEDRIEVESPGLLPIGVRLENLGQVQNTRNPLVARLMFDMNYFDEWGQGINRIIESCRENDNPPPQFEEKDSTFKVVLYARRGGKKCSLKERRSLILNFLRAKGVIISSEYQRLTGIGPAQAAKDFNLFLKENLIRRTGKGRGVKYEL